MFFYLPQHLGLVERIKNAEIFDIKSVAQDKKKEIKYTINADFTDEVAKDYLDSLPDEKKIFEILSKRDESMFLNPYIK